MIGSSLLMFGVIHHVCDDHHFMDEGLFYRFRQDDGTYQGSNLEYRQVLMVVLISLEGTMALMEVILIFDLSTKGCSIFNRSLLLLLEQIPLLH